MTLKVAEMGFNRSQSYSVTNKTETTNHFNKNTDQFIKLLSDWPVYGLNPASEATDCQSVSQSISWNQ